MAQSRERIASTWKSCLSKSVGLQVGEKDVHPNMARGQCQRTSSVRRVSAQAGCRAWVSESTWGTENIQVVRVCSLALSEEGFYVPGDALSGVGTLAGSGKFSCREGAWEDERLVIYKGVIK